MVDNREKTEEEKRRIVDKDNLENKLFIQILGSNEVKKNPLEYGQIGLNGADSAYKSAMAHEKVGELRNQIYNERQKEQDRLGIYEEPPYPSNYDISKYVLQATHGSMERLKLGDLEESVKKVATKLDFNVPDRLKAFSIEEIQEKAIESGAITSEGRIDPSKLSEEERDAINIFGLLKNSFRRSAAVNTYSENYLDDINQQGKQIYEKYHPTKEESKKAA